MSDVTLETLAARVDAIEKLLAARPLSGVPRKKEWRRVTGIFTGNDYQKTIDAEGAAIREAEPRDGAEAT